MVLIKICNGMEIHTPKHKYAPRKKHENTIPLQNVYVIFHQFITFIFREILFRKRKTIVLVRQSGNH